MTKTKVCNPSVAHKPPVKGRQLELFSPTGKRHKPQISSIPGIPPKQRDRYRVMLGDVVLGDRLTLDEAVVLTKLQKLRKRKQLTPCLELLEEQGLTGDAAIFILSEVGQVGGES